MDDIADLVARLRYCRICNSSGMLGREPCPRCNGSITIKAADALERLAACEKDAQRYRWLRDFAHPDSDTCGIACKESAITEWGKRYEKLYSGPELDAAIDAAVREGKA